MSQTTASTDTASIDLLIEDIEEDMFADPKHAIPCLCSSTCANCCNCACSQGLCRAPSPS